MHCVTQIISKQKWMQIINAAIYQIINTIIYQIINTVIYQIINTVIYQGNIAWDTFAENLLKRSCDYVVTYMSSF